MQFKPVLNLMPSTVHNTASAQGTAVDICVLGGGAVGLAAVLSALKQGFSVLHLVQAPQVQATPPHSPVPRSFAVAPQVQAHLDRLGVWGVLSSEQVQRCTDMRVFWAHGEHENRPALLHLSAAQAGQDGLCSFVSESDLLAALKTVAAAAAGQLRTVSVPALHQPVFAPHDPSNGMSVGMSITLAGHAPWRAQLCVLAQGAGSHAAAQLGVEPTVFDYQHSAVVAVLGCDAHSVGNTVGTTINPSTHNPSTHSTPNTPANTTAWQWLGSLAQGSDVLALLPLPNSPVPNMPVEPNEASCTAGRSRFGLVWSQPKAAAQAWIGQEAQLLAAVQARVGTAVGRLSLHSAVQQFPLFKSTAPFTAPHTAVVGDAAHKIHPLAGQGLNLGFEDVFALFDTIASREPWRSLGDARVLARYQRRRQAQAGAVGTLVHAIATREHWPAWLKQGSHAALRAQQAWPIVGAPLRRALVNAATRGSV